MFNTSKTMMFIPELTNAILNEDKIQTRRTIKFRLYADDMVSDGSIEIYKGVPNGCVKEMARTFSLDNIKKLYEN